MSKFLVTGGSGFIGTNLVQHLIDSGYEVLNLDMSSPKSDRQHKCWKKVDICNAPELEQNILEFSPDFVIHLAAKTDLIGKDLEYYQANTLGVRNLLTTLDKIQNLKRAVFASSMYVCEPGYRPTSFEDYAPHTIYGQSKVETEKIIKEWNIEYEWCIIRPTSIWGPFFGEPYSVFFNIVLSKKYFHLGERACKKTYGYIDNSISQIMTLFDVPTSSILKKVFYLGDYTPYDISEWANEIAAIEGIRIRRIPFFVFQLTGYFGDILKMVGVKFPMTSFRLKNMTTDNIHDLSAIQQLIPLLPVSRVEGTKKTITWIKTS